MKLTKGKIQSFENVSNEHGVISAAAMDQRGSLQKSIAKARGVDEKAIPAADMEAFKVEVTKVLTKYASAILLDPEFGLPAAKTARAPKAGLLLAYEMTGYDNSLPGRMPGLLPGWTVKRLKENGADCVKLLLYYTKFEAPEVNKRKQDFIKRVGDECIKEDIAFFLEPVGYDVKGGDGKDLAYAKIKPQIVEDYTQIFTQDVYGVDCLKVEVPVNLKYAEGAKSYKGEKAYTLEEAKKFYLRCAQASTKPMIYLSAGVSNAEFIENLDVANTSGTNYAGVLCGRATWADGVDVFAKQGVKAFTAWLNNEGVKNIQNVNKVLGQGAKAWYDKFGGKAKVAA